MDLRQLIAFAANHDMVLMDSGIHAQLCAAAAEGIAAQTDLDREFRALFEGWR